MKNTDISQNKQYSDSVSRWLILSNAHVYLTKLYRHDKEIDFDLIYLPLVFSTQEEIELYYS